MKVVDQVRQELGVMARPRIRVRIKGQGLGLGLRAKG